MSPACSSRVWAIRTGFNLFPQLQPAVCTAPEGRVIPQSPNPLRRFQVNILSPINSQSYSSLKEHKSMAGKRRGTSPSENSECRIQPPRAPAGSEGRWRRGREGGTAITPPGRARPARTVTRQRRLREAEEGPGRARLRRDISHVLASAFKDLYTGDVFEVDMLKFLSIHPCLWQLLAEYKSRLTEADKAEEEIIQAQARAKAEEERILNEMKIDAGEDFHKLGLPPVASSFRWIVDNELLRKNNLICPEDYITEKLPLAKKTKASQKQAGKESKSWEAEETLSRLEKRQNYLKNPRFFPPNTLHGGKSLVISQEKVEEIIARRKAQDTKGYFTGTFPEEDVIINTTANLGKFFFFFHFLPFFCFYFSPQGKYPGKGGMIAPGMACQYTVQFIPECLGDYEDHIFVESQVSEPFVIPIQAKVSLPVLTLPDIIDCGSCLVGGIKTTAVLCRNEGVRTGKFSIMPKRAWPAPDSGVAASADFVIQDPFAIQPAVLEVAPGQNATVEVSANCWVGESIALELLFVTGGESKAQLGEVTDATAQHLIRFEPQNPHTTMEKILVIKNSTHIELPFFWQITKPNLKPLIPEETADFTQVKHNQDPESAFSLNPEHGVLLPHADHEFILSYTPQELKSYHSVIQMVLRDIPESPCLVEEGMLQNIPECRVQDVIALEIEVKGATEPFHFLLEPYAIIVPGENFIGANVKKTFKLWNYSKTLIKYTWETITACEIMEVEPRTGVIDVKKCCEFELAISGSKPGVISRNLQCYVEPCPEPVVLHVEAAFKGPFLCIDVPSLQFGLTKQGETVSRTFEIKNLCQVPAQWRMQESQVFLAERNEEVSTFSIQPSAGEIPPLGLCRVSVQFTALQCQRLQTVLELEVENGKGSHLPVFVEVQTPQACLISSHLVFTEIYTGIPVKATSKLFNQTLLPAKYLWGKLIGSQAASCSIVVSPASGILGPNEEKEFCIQLSANTVGELKDLMLSCSIEDMTEPLFLRISGEVKGLHVTYSVSSGNGIDSDEGQMPQSPCELLLDFGSEVAFKGVVKRRLILTNTTPIRAPFTLEADYFTACVLPPEQKVTQNVERLSLLSQGKGAAFYIQPSAGTLEAFQQLTIEIAAYNNMWGEYQDNLVCKVGGVSVLPWQILPIVFPRLISDTSVLFSGESPVLRRVQLNNPTPFDIRLDLEVYNQEPDDEKLVDLLVLFGDPFPPVDMAGNGAASSGSTSESEVETSSQESTGEKNISVLIRPHEGVPADSPYCTAPRQIVVPGGGSSDVYISFTPLVLPDTEAELGCEAVLLGFMSLDDKVNRLSQQDPCWCSMTRQSNTNLSREFKLTSSESFLPQVLTDAVITQSLKLMNCTKVPLYFRLFLSTPSTPFSFSITDPEKSTKSSHKFLFPQVKVSFHTTLELLRYQHLPETQLLPGCQMLQLENGERKLKFNQNLVIEHSNHTTQLVPVSAYLTIPVLELSCDMVDFQTCFVAQTKIEHVFLYNRSGCRSYWTALLGILQFWFCNWFLCYRVSLFRLHIAVTELFPVHFRSNTVYEAIVTISGMLEEKPSGQCGTNVKVTGWMQMCHQLNLYFHLLQLFQWGLEF
uniref:DLEC1 cilia and flagella associated protein n=1 Tax=Cyanistes caeruleus TaxID=156563 RepID=A0A8C0UHG9_CYACU